MVKLVIRDDDCNFFTNPEDLKSVYERIPHFPISFAVVPMVTDVIGGCPETHGNTTPRYVGDNKALVDYLHEKLENQQCDVCLHGITHGYHFTKKGVKIPEMQWREIEDSEIESKISYYKNDFEGLFGIPITCFVAPSNRLMRKGTQAVYRNGLNYSGIIPIDFERDFTVSSIKNYTKRIFIRATKGVPYPGILDYGTHKEFNACNNTKFDYLKSMFHYCQKLDSPMAINVHYWHIRDYPELYKGFFDFIHYAMDHGAVPARMRDCI